MLTQQKKLTKLKEWLTFFDKTESPPTSTCAWRVINMWVATPNVAWVCYLLEYGAALYHIVFLTWLYLQLTCQYDRSILALLVYYTGGHFCLIQSSLPRSYLSWVGGGVPLTLSVLTLKRPGVIYTNPELGFLLIDATVHHWDDSWSNKDVIIIYFNYKRSI